MLNLKMVLGIIGCLLPNWQPNLKESSLQEKAKGEKNECNVQWGKVSSSFVTSNLLWYTYVISSQRTVFVYLFVYFCGSHRLDQCSEKRGKRTITVSSLCVMMLLSGDLPEVTSRIQPIDLFSTAHVAPIQVVFKFGFIFFSSQH